MNIVMDMSSYEIEYSAPEAAQAEKGVAHEAMLQAVPRLQLATFAAGHDAGADRFLHGMNAGSRISRKGGAS